jgi:branched-chain amino acid transport system substrate-binding protein
VPRLVDDASVMGVVGPTFSGETESTGAIFDQAGLVATTPAATNVTFSQNTWHEPSAGMHCTTGEYVPRLT